MEIYQDFGNDLVLTLNGDLQTVDGTQLSIQRIIRRLLTNPDDYLWHPDYGAGLGRYIGEQESPDILSEIKGLIVSQMQLEDSVSQTPPPDIQISGLPDQLNCTITYTVKYTNQQAVITFSA